MRPVGSKYLIEETLGRGAMGTVWRGRVREDAGQTEPAPGQPVAIKVLKEELATDQDIVLRFLRERSVLLRLNHPNIVRVRDLVVEGELLALVMDLVDGPDLHRYLRANGPLSPISAALLMAQIADALAASHADGVVHRDLKPANVLLATVSEAGGEVLRPLLTDFGIARLADSPGITRTSEFVGTPSYVAPESAAGRPQTEAVDIYGAGIMLYELTTGRPPFQGDGALQVLQAHLTQEPVRPPGVPEPLWTVVERCLRKDPGQRPGATALAHALRVVAAGVGVHASPAAVDAALAVGALLLPPAQPTVVPGTGHQPTLPDGAGDPTRVMAPQYDPAAATQVLPGGQQPGLPDGTRVMPAGAEGTRLMPPAQPLPNPGAPQQPPAQPDGPHPWQTQLRAARDRNQATQVFTAQEYEQPQQAPRPYQGGQPGGYQGGGQPAGYQGGPGQRPPRPQQGGQPAGGRPERPPVAPPPYQARRPQPEPGRYGNGSYGEPDRYAERRPQPGGREVPPGGAPPRAPERRYEPPAPREAEPPVHEPRQRREPRPRSRNRMYIPGLGCLKGCLMVLLILAIAALALWNFTPLPHYWDDVHGWYDQVSGWVSSTWHSITGK
ncbi:serine/threonine-protein kinase [Kitasatospora viridis]|uniref:non-specific serine/threonine protein kinase n=1 Tax=Kitasatospora viridis TaxID=281105 RepID=A0A561UK47_9ACTN|nr:serine/threonine-protein kinase [Kitasatospora viridis]TWF99740.1 serine/threonine-protein kinase [Kitasatospora viridis]